MIQKNEKQFPNIPKKFEYFPKGWKPRPAAFALTRTELLSTLQDGTPTLVSMDINICEDGYVEAVNKYKDKKGNILSKKAEELYDCDIGCKHCFDCKTTTNNPLMKTEEVFDMLKEAKTLGLKMVKFLGPGELLHNPKLFEILDFLQKNNIRIGIFTKGLVLGSDNVTKSKFNMTAKDLCEKLYNYPNVSILLGMTSANEQKETSRIDSVKQPKIFDIRNKAFENLAEIGFNQDRNNQRLTLVCSPILEDNIDEVLDIYDWGIRRNIPVIVAPTMVSGKGLEQKEVSDENFKEKIVNLYAEIYCKLIEYGIMDIEQIKKDGISPYAGVPCNQFLGGFMQRKDGKLQGCPGNETENYVYTKDFRKSGSLIEQWGKSLNCILRLDAMKKGKDIPLTNPCYAKQEGLELNGKIPIKKGCGSIPEGFEEKVLKKIYEKIGYMK